MDDFPALEPFDISSSLRVTFRERKSLKAFKARTSSWSCIVESDEL